MNTDAEDRRRDRLRDELNDEGVPLPIDGPHRGLLLDELLYALRPPVHEGRVPRYGAILLPTESTTGLPGATFVPTDGRPIDLVRRHADGRGSFSLVAGGRYRGLACFDRTREYESDAVELCRDGGLVIQRHPAGPVRVCSPDGIITWDTTRWRFKAPAEAHEVMVRRLAPGADRLVLSRLLGLAVHWLSAGRVGSTLVWRFADRPDRADRAGSPDGSDGLDHGSSIPAPPLDITERAHLPALLSGLGQIDRAAVIGPTGIVTHLGAELTSSAEAESLVAPVGGTRHTSARRYSFDHLDTIVVVVSEDGPVTVFIGGAAAAELRNDPCGADDRTWMLPALAEADAGDLIACPTCDRCLLVDRITTKNGKHRGSVRCPVCDERLDVDAGRAVVRGVRVGATP